MIKGAFRKVFAGAWTGKPAQSASSFEDVERAERILYLQNVRAGMTVFDVGANVGELTMLFSRLVGRDGRVHAFEPTPSTFARLETLCGAAGLMNTTLNQVALGERSGEIQFHLYDGEYHPWNSRAARPLANYGINIAAPARETVRCVTLDAYCSAAGITGIDLLKIDVEGAELEVLLGAEGMLRERRIRQVIFEFGQTTFDMGHWPSEFVRFFDDRGYRIDNIVSGEPIFPGGASVETAAFAIHIAVPGNEK